MEKEGTGKYNQEYSVFRIAMKCLLHGYSMPNACSCVKEVYCTVDSINVFDKIIDLHHEMKEILL